MMKKIIALIIVLFLAGCANQMQAQEPVGASQSGGESGNSSNNDLCRQCPQYTPPAPGWCDGGTIIPGEKDDCGCDTPPTCGKNEPAADSSDDSSGSDDPFADASVDFASQYCEEGAHVFICGSVVKVKYDSLGKGTEYYKEGEVLSFECPVIGMHDMTDECKAMMDENCGDDICS